MRREKKRGAVITWEGFRWGSPWVLLALSAASALLYVLELPSNDIFLDDLKDDGVLVGSVFEYLCLTGSSGFLCMVSLCSVVFLGAGIYAQDYQESAVYMRIQRMGMKRYAGVRILQTCISSWLVGCLGILLAIPLAAAVFHQVPFYPDYVESMFLTRGNSLVFLAAYGCTAGFRAMFYALMTLLFSCFVPKRRVLLALPLLLWYFNQYVIQQEWIPLYIQPCKVFEVSVPMSLADLSEWQTLWYRIFVLLGLSAAVWFVCLLRLKRTGIFGGEQSE